MSVPLLVGFFLWGSAVLFAWWVILLAPWTAPRIWPQLSGTQAAVLAAVVAGIVWLPAFVVEANLLIALCGPGLVGVVVPAALATTAYLAVGLVGALTQRVSLWLAAALLTPVTYALAAHWLNAATTC